MPEELVKFIREEAERSNYELVDISAKGGRESFLEVVIDKEGGVTLDECSSFNRKIMSWIDEQNVFDRGYTLDVCSPGLDRELKSDNDFSWAIGKQVEVKVHEPLDKKNLIVGKLLKGNTEEGVTIEADGNTFCVKKDNIVKVRLWFSV
jgi:ribosome maturation factor RimP